MKVLWSSMLRGRPLDDRIVAAATSGYDALSVGPDDLAELRASERGPAEAARFARETGVELAIYDAVVEWYDHEPPKRPMSGTGVGLDQTLSACAAFGVTLVNAVAPYPTSSPIEHVAAQFGVLCDQVSAFAAIATIEFTPYPPVASLEAGWDVVRLAARPNGKLLVDTWHLFRSDSDPALLREIPGERIGAVQVSDGDAELTMALMKATVGARRLPGDGDFDLASMLDPLRESGGLTRVGPEVMTLAWGDTPTADIARASYAACERVGAW